MEKSNEKQTDINLECGVNTTTYTRFKDQLEKSAAATGYAESDPEIPSYFGAPMMLLKRGPEDGPRQTMQSYDGPPNEIAAEVQLRYMELDRLLTCCTSFLTVGNGRLSILPSNSVDAHIARMKELWNSFPDDGKPKWLTWEQIEQLEANMKRKQKTDAEVHDEIL